MLQNENMVQAKQKEKKCEKQKEKEGINSSNSTT